MGDAYHPAKRRNLRRVLAITASLLLHILVIAGMVISTDSSLAKRTTKGEGQADVEGVQLDLVGLHHAEAKPQQETVSQPLPPQQQAMEAMQQMANQAQPPATKPNDYSLAKPQARSLAQVFGADPFQPSSMPNQASEAAKTQKAAHVQIRQNTNATMNDLWKAIAPCWRRVADKNTQDVTLQISFSPLGSLAKPPAILRPPGSHIDDRLLRSENQAITALAQCGPYLMAAGQQDVKVLFPGPS